MGKISDVIDSKLKELGIPGSKMCDDLNMSRSTLTELRKGRATTLKTEKAAAIASYLGISVEELIGKEKAPTPKDERPITMDSFGFAMQNEGKTLTDADKQILLTMARQLNDARRKENGEADSTL